VDLVDGEQEGEVMLRSEIHVGQSVEGEMREGTRAERKRDRDRLAQVTAISDTTAVFDPTAFKAV
jgi:hypothetical protein